MGNLENYKNEIKRNFFLLKLCRAACPVAQVTGIETYTPHSIISIIYYLETQQMEWKEENIHPIYMCNMCGRCDSYCKGMNFVEIIESARAKALTLGVAPKKILKLKEKVSKDVESALEHLEKFDKSVEGSEILLLLGFNYWRETERVSRILQLFEDLGVKYDFLGSDEPYMGEIYFDLGFIEEGLDNAKKALEVINNYKQVIVVDPATLYTLLRRYEAFDLTVKPRVLHYTTYLSEKWLEKIKKGVNLQGATAYNDPCELARLNIIKEPRNILKKMKINLKELHQNGINTYPVGGCFSFNLIEPEIAIEITIERISEILDLNIGNIITTSNRDREELEKVTKKANIDLKIYDLIDIIKAR